MSNFVPLEEAAKKLGVSADELVEMLGRGEIFGYRDGASWKFKPTEIERVASEMMGDALDEDPAGSSILMSDSELGLSSSHGSTIGSDVLSNQGDSSSDPDSDVALVADPGSGSDVRLVASNSDDDLRLADDDDDDDELELAAEDGDDLLANASDAVDSGKLKLGSDISVGSGLGSDIPLSDSDRLDLTGSDASNVLGGSDISLGGGSEIIKGDSDPAIDSSGLGLGGSDLELTDDGDLVLGGGSDLALGTDSGINLMSPADSGISLEDEPLDLAASGISGLDLAAEGSDPGLSGSGSAVDFQQDEEFQLSPSGALDTDDDSGSQVIELEDSSEFGDVAVDLPAADGFDAFADVDSGASEGFAPAGAAVTMGYPEVPYSLLEVLGLLGILLLMCLSGILVSDIVRNMWAWSGSGSDLTSGFTDMILSALSMKN